MTSNNTDSKLRNLIRKALQRTGISMRQASLSAGMSDSWVRDIVDGSICDPGISAMVRLCNLLGIDKRELS